MNATPPPVARGSAESCAEAMDGDLGWALGVIFRRYLKAAGLATDQLPGGPRGYQVLRSAAAEAPSTQLTIAQQLGVDRTVMTYLLDDLEREGLIERLADPNDRRVRRIAATPAGRARLAQLRERLAEAERHALAGLGEQEQVTLRTMVNRLARLVTAGEPPASTCELAEDAGIADSGIPTRRRPRRLAHRG